MSEENNADAMIDWKSRAITTCPHMKDAPFWPGDTVECIKGSNWEFPVVGTVYAVKSVRNSEISGWICSVNGRYYHEMPCEWFTLYREERIEIE